MRSLVLLAGLCLVCVVSSGMADENQGQNVVRFIRDFMKLQQRSRGTSNNDLDSLTLSHLNSTETDEQFHAFIAKYEKPYDHKTNLDEYLIRKAIFTRNLVKIALLNNLEQGTAVYGVNEFADMDDHEFIKNKLGYRRLMRPDTNMMGGEANTSQIEFEAAWSELLEEENKTEEELMSEAPVSFDWRQKKGVVSPVKDQGSCGSCWAFSTTGNIEGQLKIRKNVSVSLSEEELVDCDTVDQGCSGGLPQKAFDQVIKLGGLETEADYPYNPQQSKNGCRMASKAPKYSITSFINLPKDEERLKVWLSKRGPISIGVNAYAMQWYRSGVSHPWKFLCNPLQLDHAVLIVGYGVDNTKKRKGPKPYWIIKNSWSTQWGEQGYYRLLRGKNVCGVAEDCSSAVVSSGH